MKKQKKAVRECDIFQRSKDFYSPEEFKKIQKTKVLICGVGGMGGVCLELLVRTGFKDITIADFDHFETSNSNRQIYCNVQNLGKSKAMVMKRELRKINPYLKVQIVKEGVTDSNMRELINKHDVVVNGIDNPAYSILLRRACYEMKKFCADAWLTPAVCSFSIHPDHTKGPEEEMGYGTEKLTTSKEFNLDIKKSCLRKDIERSHKKIETSEILPENVLEDVLNYKYQRHFPAMVWMCGCLMSLEIFKFVTGKGNPAPVEGFYFNYMDFKTA